MKCFNCGRETSAYLCRDCLTAPVLDRVFTEIRFYIVMNWVCWKYLKTRESGWLWIS